MKTKWIKSAFVLASVLMANACVQAIPIVGGIGFTGGYTQNGGTSGDLTTATSFTINTVNVGSTSGAFVGAFGPTFATPITVNPANNLMPNVQLWSVLVGSTLYKFNVSQETETTDTASLIQISCVGTISDGTLADDTGGNWTLSFRKDGFSWSSTGANVPDGGATVILLGLALTSVALISRKLVA